MLVLCYLPAYFQVWLDTESESGGTELACALRALHGHTATVVEPPRYPSTWLKVKLDGSDRIMSIRSARAKHLNATPSPAMPKRSPVVPREHASHHITLIKQSTPLMLPSPPSRRTRPADLIIFKVRSHAEL